MIFILKCVLVLLLLVRVVYTDVRVGKIENRTLFIFLTIGGIISIIDGGYIGFFAGMKMVILVTVILFLLYLVKGLGAGDIKLFAVLSLYFPDEAIGIIGVSFVVAGIWAILKMVYRGIKRKKILVAGETIHFSIPIAIATVLVVLKIYLL